MQSLLHTGLLKLPSTSRFEWSASLLLRLYLAPIFLQAGWTKLLAFNDTVLWFEHSLNLPLPTLLTVLALGSEIIGGVFLLLGLGVRLIALPLMLVMLVAAFLVHFENGWLAISDSSSWLANQQVLDAAEKKQRIIAILQEHGNYEWLTSNGTVTILNNGVEFAITYFIMLLALFFLGAGRYVSLDYWLQQRLHSH
ncbi:HvfX family Cu-binding RiPP maturation protein [Pseudoalteromonas piratica]|uniref:Membrane protein n=1 Tax=Pseudoalteromonas piratica TaxID=1348114 RepID=A0A0A7ELF1_9GAMM|nr:DoxX family protein [Pseudoalteromonas piratica]AIY66782.1 membrane protein [Pseudoalteromonas piratica]